MTIQELLAIAKPILFNTPMVQAILDDIKTVTRRVIKLPHCGYFENEPPRVKSKYSVGDILYVRETWCWCPCWDCGMNTEKGCCDDTANRFYNDKRKENGCYGYRASFETGEQPFDKWRPSIHMPKEAARIFLRVTAVGVERLQDITIDGVKQEGVPLTYPLIAMVDSEHLKKFIAIWDSTIKKAELDKYSWNANPWVGAYEFERVKIDE